MMANRRSNICFATSYFANSTYSGKLNGIFRIDPLQASGMWRSDIVSEIIASIET